jgi:hypothetical protein
MFLDFYPFKLKAPLAVAVTVLVAVDLEKRCQPFLVVFG